MEIRKRVINGDKKIQDPIIRKKIEKKGYGKIIFYAIVIILSASFIIFNAPDIIEPHSYSYPERPSMSGILTPNNILSMAERKAENDLFGPESFALYKDEIYTSSKQGIFKLKESRIEFVARIGKLPCDTLQDELTCGRPLGIEFNSHGMLYVADAYLGIYTVNVSSINKVEAVIGKELMAKEKIKFINSLQISESGDIYFTSSSTRWDRNKFIYAVLEAKPDGRVFKYDSQTKKLSVIVDNLQFPNGLLLSPAENYLLISESVGAAILKFYLRGPYKGKLETLCSNLPMFPDNIKYNLEGNILVTAAVLRVKEKLSPLDFLASRPLLKKYLFKVIKPEWTLSLTPKYGLVVEINIQDGSIIRSFHDPTGKVYALSEAMQIGNKLYLGSYVTPFYSVLDLTNIP